MPGSTEIWNHKTKAWDKFENPVASPFLAFGGWQLAVPADSKNAEAAWSFVADVTSPEVSGKAIREVSLSTPGGMACVDFAVAHGFSYVLYDAGWYGHEYDDAADARAVNLDPKRVGGVPNHPGLDLPAVLAYAKSRGIGVFLYVNRRALERQLDELLPLYASWGVAGDTVIPTKTSEKRARAAIKRIIRASSRNNQTMAAIEAIL